METLYLWRYSHPTGARVVMLDRFTEAEALRVFPEPERVEGSDVQAEREGRSACTQQTPVRREERAAMMAVDSALIVGAG